MDEDWQSDLERWLAPYLEGWEQDATPDVSGLYRWPDWARGS
jgi:hypothetical protein